MGAILGLVGEGSLAELRDMAAPLAPRGRLTRVLTPAAGVLLGQCGHAAAPEGAGTAVGDCQLDNADALRERLAAHGRPDVGGDDADLLAALIGAFGIAGLAHVRGYFSVACWDERERSLTLACDTAGFRLLRFVAMPGRLAFASAYKALLALPDLNPQPDRDAIQYYLAAMHPPLGSTFLAGVSTMTGGEVIVLREGHWERRRYWTPAVLPVRRTRAGHVAAVREAFLDVVRRKVRPYPRIGFTMSGGLDAPAILAAVRQVKPEAQLVTFTIGSGGSDPEIVGAARVAEHFGTEHHALTFAPESLPQDLPRMIWLMEDCHSREEGLLQFQVMRGTGQQVPVVMAGHGADALLGGMPRHRLIRLAATFPALTGPLTEIYGLTQIGKPPESWLGRLMAYAIYRGREVPPPKVIGAGLGPTVPWPGTVDRAAGKEVLDMPTFRLLEPLHQVEQVHFQTPYLDPDFVATTLSVPAAVRGGLRDQKAILRAALEGLLPPEILLRPKAIQRVRHDQVLSDILDHMADERLTPEAVRQRGLVDPAFVAAVRRRPPGAAYPNEQLYRLWSLVSLETWARQFLDGAGAPAGVSPEGTA